MAGKAPSTYSRIYAVIQRVPRGRVATYGQIAGAAGLVNAARQVGYALHALPQGSPVPWHRIVNARGSISLRDSGALTQRLRLEREGVRFTARGRVDLDAFGWRPARRASRRRRGQLRR